MVNNTKQDEKEELFSQIRDLHASKTTSADVEERYSLKCLKLGQLIATGCNAAVYEARLTNEDKTPSQTQNGFPATDGEESGETDSDISIIDEEESDSDNSMAPEEESDISVIEEAESDSEVSIVDEELKVSVEDMEGSLVAIEGFMFDPGIIDEELEVSVEDMEGSLVAIEGFMFDPGIIDEEGSMSFSIIEEESDVIILDEGSESDYSAICDPDADSEAKGDDSLPDLLICLLPKETWGTNGEKGETRAVPPDFDLAVKMMFNYDAESNAEAVLRAMDKEVVPISTEVDALQREEWHNGNHVKKKAWPSHPNIVSMYGLFVDEIPDIPDNIEHYPAALPSRIHPDGLGRNMTLFLVMKRYSCTLTDFLVKENPSMTTRCFLLCQLLEGVAFLQQQKVAHRDIKGDNLLIDLSSGSDWPLLVISDFGCCLNEGTLQIPYVTSEINKGGNSALMAPEIACAVAGGRSFLDYRKSDQWAAGALVYEIMGCPNPFYRSKMCSARLDSRTYREKDLPSLPDEVPVVVKKLTRNLLSRNTGERMSASAAATVMQLHMWGGLDQLCDPGITSNGIRTLQNWTVNLAAETALARMSGHSHLIQNNIKQIFLSRVSHRDLEKALQFLQSV